MLQIVLFSVMNTTIMGAPCDMAFIENMGALEKLSLRATESLIWHCKYIVCSTGAIQCAQAYVVFCQNIAAYMEANGLSFSLAVYPTASSRLLKRCLFFLEYLYLQKSPQPQIEN